MPLALDGRALDAAVFDVDGVIAPTLDNHVRAYRETLEPLGVPVAFIDVALREGQRSPEVLAWLCEKAGKPVTAETAKELGVEKNRRYRSYPVPPPYPGLARLLDALKARGLRLALATGTSGKNVPHVLGDLLPRFDAVVAAEDYTRAKPDPEPYLAAAAKLGAAPARCLVVENAPLGVRSGKAAGAFVAALATTLPAERLKEADRVLASHEELLALVQGQDR